jgi:hypothetical protein
LLSYPLIRLVLGVTNAFCFFVLSSTGKTRLVQANVMTEEQYLKAETALVKRLQAMRETESGLRSLVPKQGPGSDGSEDTLDDEYDAPISSEHQAAHTEWMQYCSLVKHSKKFPKKFKKEGLLKIGRITFGIVEEKGDDIDANHPFRRCNLADFIDKKGYFNLVQFIGYNQKSFPFIYKLACCLAAMRMNEVGCERFFSIAGYVSNARRTRLKVRHYEAMAMLKRNMQQIFIDEDWVVQQYQKLEKSKEWDEIETANDQMVQRLEAELYADDLGVTVDALELEDLEEQPPAPHAAAKAIEVHDSDDDDTDTDSHVS